MTTIHGIVAFRSAKIPLRAAEAIATLVTSSAQILFHIAQTRFQKEPCFVTDLKITNGYKK